MLGSKVAKEPLIEFVFPQQLLCRTRGAIQHLCWAPSDESLRACQAVFYSFRKETQFNGIPASAFKVTWA